MKINRFWNWTKDEASGERILRMDGEIASENWWGDEVTPAAFLAELQAGEGNITIWLNSPGGCCIAASRIYTMLMDYKGDVTIKIDGLAASAASVIAMAGTKVQIAPTAWMMIHNPATIAIGDSEEMLKAAAMLDEVKEGIMNAYQIKTGMNRKNLSNLMDAESFFNANRAVELGFADGLLVDEKLQREPGATNAIYSPVAVTNSLMEKVMATVRKHQPKAPTPQGIPIESLEKRLSLLSK